MDTRFRFRCSCDVKMFQHVDKNGPVDLKHCPRCHSMYNCSDRGSIFTPLILQCAHVHCESCIREQILNNSSVTCIICGLPSIPQGEIYENYHNLREHFPIAEYTISQILEIETQKFVDESKIGFKVEPSLVDSTESGLKLCDECSLRIAKIRCHECRSLLCDECFAEVHQKKTLQSHHKTLLNVNNLSMLEVNNYRSGIKHVNEEFKIILENLHKKCIEKQIRIRNTLSTLSSNVCQSHLRKGARSTEYLDLRDQLSAHFSYAHNVLLLMQKTAEEKLEKVFNSMDNSIRNCEQQLILLKQNLDKCFQNLTSALLLPDTSHLDVPSMIKEFELLLAMPHSITMTKAIEPQKKFELSDNWIQHMKEECNFDFGVGPEIILVPTDVSSLESSAEQIPEVNSSVTISSSYCSTTSKNTRKNNGFFFDFKTKKTSVPVHTNSLTTNKDCGTYNNCDLFTSSSTSEYGVSQSHGSVGKCIGFKVRGNVTCNIPANECKADTTNLMHLKSHQFYQYDPIFLPGRKKQHEKESGHVDKVYRSSGGLFRKRDVALMKTLQNKTFSVGASYHDVVVSYIEDPSHFYVLSPNVSEVLTKFERMYSSVDTLPILTLKEAEKDIVCLAKTLNNTWCRVRVVNVSPHDINESLSEVSVFLIDSGQKELLTLANCRKFTENMRDAQLQDGLAKRCSLFNCYPTQSPVWEQEIIDDFKKRVQSNSPLIMNVYKVNAHRYDVDLVYKTESGSVSLCEYLLATSRAQYCSPKESVVECSKPLKYFHDKDFRIDEWVDVQVSHINSPADFYIRRTADSILNRKYSDLISRLGYIYRSKENYLKGAVSNLVPGMAVAAHFTHDNKWYRAEIIDRAAKNHYIVRYVDFGNTEKLPWARIRSLPEELTHFNIQAVHCTLYGVAPIKMKWSKKAIMYFASSVENKKLRMIVKEIVDGCLIVSLHENLNSDSPDCINVKLIERGLVKGIGENAKVQVLRQEESLSVKKNSKKADEVSSLADSSTTETNVVDQDSTTGDKDSSAKKGKEEVTENYKSNEIKWRVIIADFIDPSKIYIQLADRRHVIIDLMNEMTKYYRNEENSEYNLLHSPKEKMTCAIYHEKDEKWYRGIIQNLIDENTTQVFLNDIAITEIVPLKNLRNLPDIFKKNGDGAVRCSLFDVDYEDDWSDERNEMIKTHLEKYDELYIIRKGRKLDSMLIELWGKQIICADPLEPSIEDWTNINELVKNRGIDEKIQQRCKNYKPPFEENLKKLEQEIGLKNPTEHVRDWLESNISEASVKGVEYSTLKNFGDECDEPVADFDEDDLECLASVSIINNADEDWLPPTPLTETDFIGMPTYVDSDFNVYIQINGKYNGILDIISNGLQSRYQNTRPTPDDLIWSPGQICVALYFIDQKWYRARVLEIDKKNGKVQVEYVDFGNVEWLEPSSLRKQVALREIPVQCYKFPVRSDCVPSSGDGKWLIPALEFIHVTIVEKISHIQLRKEPGEEFYRIEKLMLPEQYDLFELLYQLNHAICISSTKENKSFNNKSKSKNKVVAETETPTGLNSIQEEESDSSGDEMSQTSSIDPVENISNIKEEMINLKMIQEKSLVSVSVSSIKQTADSNELQVSELQVPIGSIVKVEVTELFSWDVIAVNVIDSYDYMSIIENRKEFTEMNEELQVDAIKQPLLKAPYIGRVCCTKFEDGQWYRAIVLDNAKNNSSSVSVFYIDYGNISNVNISELHQLKRDWYHVKAQAVKCVLENVKLPSPSIDEQKYAKKLTKFLLGKTFEAVFKAKPRKKDPLYLIRLIIDENDSMFFN